MNISPAAGPGPLRPGAVEPVIHQALHGYDHGHRLLAASRVIPEEDLRLIDRLSDASGPRAVAGNDGYLTGYPLPSGEAYALARTWYVKDAPRPNVVLTRTLLLPLIALNFTTLSGLTALLVPPSADGDYAVTLTLPAGTDKACPVAGHVELDPLLAGLYQSVTAPPSSEVWFTDSLVERRNEVCLAVWDQQWPRLRGAFAFCAGAVESRQLTDRPFDLLGTPAGTRGLPPVPSVDTLAPGVVTALAADLRSPGMLRDFLRLVGADSSRRRVMPLLVETFLLVNANPLDPAAVLRHLTRRAPRPTSMRRLKRTLLAPKNGLLQPAPPLAVLHAVLAPKVAPHVLAADAGLDAWAARAWQNAPDATLDLLLTLDLADPTDNGHTKHGVVRHPDGRPASGRPDGPNVGHGTVAHVAPGILGELVAQQAAPTHLARLTAARPALAASVLLHHRHEPAWWAAWARLPDNAFTALMSAATMDTVQDALELAVDALLTAPQGIVRYRAVRDTGGAVAVAALLSRLGARRSSPTAWLPVLAEHSGLLVEVLDGGRSTRELAVAIDVVPDTAFAKSVGWPAWQPLAERPADWSRTPRRCAVLYIAASQHVGDLSDLTLATSYQALYQAFSAGGADDAWQLTAPLTSGKHDAWDRCRRLAHATARTVGERHGQPRPAVLALIADESAGAALVEELVGQHRPKTKGDDRGNGTTHPLEALLKTIRPW